MPLRNLRLPSLQTAQIQQWLAKNADRRILVIPDGPAYIGLGPGQRHRRPARTVTVAVTEAEYQTVLAMQAS